MVPSLLESNNFRAIRADSPLTLFSTPAAEKTSRTRWRPARGNADENSLRKVGNRPRKTLATASGIPVPPLGPHSPKRSRNMYNAAAQVAIIDDDFGQRTGLARLIQSVGINTSLYESAEDFLGASPDHASCVLTDMRMPGMSGLQLQHELHNREMHVPLIVLTGHADVPAAVQSMKAGAFDFIEKPCSPHVLLETVQSALR